MLQYICFVIDELDVNWISEVSGVKISPEKKICVEGKEYVWSSEFDKIRVVREGVPYGSVEVLSKRMGRPVKMLLEILGLPQTTYNKKKLENSKFESRETELLLRMVEIMDQGVFVFNGEEEKFLRWLGKPNLSLGGLEPNQLFDTIVGLDQVEGALLRLDSGSLA